MVALGACHAWAGPVYTEGQELFLLKLQRLLLTGSQYRTLASQDRHEIYVAVAMYESAASAYNARHFNMHVNSFLDCKTSKSADGISLMM